MLRLNPSFTHVCTLVETQAAKLSAALRIRPHMPRFSTLRGVAQWLTYGTLSHVLNAHRGKEPLSSKELEVASQRSMITATSPSMLYHERELTYSPHAPQ